MKILSHDHSVAADYKSVEDMGLAELAYGGDWAFELIFWLGFGECEGEVITMSSIVDCADQSRYFDDTLGHAR